MVNEILFFKYFKILHFINKNYIQRLYYIGNSQYCILGINFINDKLNFLRVFNNTLINK
jgi:hypothetical protein